MLAVSVEQILDKHHENNEAYNQHVCIKAEVKISYLQRNYNACSNKNSITLRYTVYRQWLLCIVKNQVNISSLHALVHAS